MTQKPIHLGRANALNHIQCYTKTETKLLENNHKTSDEHFRWSPVIDRLKSQKTDCSNPPWDLGLIKIQVWWSHVSWFLRCCRQACYYFPTKFKHRFHAKDRCVDQCIWIAEAPCFGSRKWACIVHGQSTLCLFFVGSIAEPKVNS